MGDRMRSKDWSRTPLDGVETWPGSLKTSISIMLASRFAMVVAWGPDFRFFYNDRYRPVLGASKHPAALGTPAKEIFPEAWPFIGPLFESTRRGESVALDDVLIPLDRNGYLENCYFTLSYSPIRDEFGAVGGMLAVVAETTERVEGERRLKTLRELARRAVEAESPEQACENAASSFEANPIDVPFCFFYLLDENGTASRLVASSGIAPDAGIGDWPLQEVAESRQVLVLDDLTQSFGHLPGGPYPEPVHTAVLVPLARPGQPRSDGILVFGVSPRRALDDLYRGFFELAADHILTGIRNALAHQEERQRTEALAELDRAKTTFFSNVSHEFRTPLTLMVGPLENLLRVNDMLPREAREQIETAHRNSLRLLKLVNTLLDFSRIEAGRVDAAFEPVDLAAYTAELCSVFRSMMERAGLEFVVDCAPLNQSVFLDRDMWEKVVLNLLSNAFKFTHRGSIHVSLRRDGEMASLTVTDTGTGIPSEELPHIFKRFHRIKGAHGRTYEGTGIGLALVQELVRIHGGNVHVVSTIDAGTTFIVSIPFGDAHLPAQRPGSSRASMANSIVGEAYIEEAQRWLSNTTGNAETAARAGDKRPSILLADDNADMRDYVSRLLSTQFDVTCTADGQSALEAAKKEKPDLVLSDIMMPLLDGVGLVQELRADPKLHTVPIILLSARAGEDESCFGLAAGADDYLVKPFSARELTARVATHIRMAALRRQSEETIRGLKDEAEKANRLKDEFLATVSHELRTPLNAMLGWTRLMREGKLDEVKQLQALEVLERNALAQSRLIEDILDASRIINGKLFLEFSPVEVAAVVEEAVASMKPSADAKDLRIKTVNDSGLNVVLGDPARMQQIVWNLLSNAVKFTPRGGQIDVVLQRVDSNLQISVRDTGRGISKEFLPFVFERFRQADSSTTRQVGGLGLGLAIVRHLTELHGGTVDVASPGENQGSTFTVRLPLASSQQATLPPCAL